MNIRVHLRFPSLAAIVLLIAIVGCNVPVEQVPPPGDVQTAAALTLQAILTPSATRADIATATRAPTRSATGTSTPRVTGTAPTASSASTTTPTYSVPMLTVREATNCRSGPGEAYDIIFTYITGKQLEIAGRYDTNNYWLVKSSESPTGTCWLWGEYVDVTGSFWAVSSVTPPPTLTAQPPRAPGILSWEFVCSGGTLTFTVAWADNASNEQGYRIFRNGQSLVDLPANTTTYTDNYVYSPEESVEYYLQAFGPSGTANSSIMRMRC